jgi:hypothetical protein
VSLLSGGVAGTTWAGRSVAKLDGNQRNKGNSGSKRTKLKIISCNFRLLLTTTDSGRIIALSEAKCVTIHFAATP